MEIAEIERRGGDTRGVRDEEEGDAPAGATVARLVGDLSPRARDLALQGVAAARAADAGDPFGYLGGLVNMRALESDGDGDAALAMDVTPNALNRYGYVPSAHRRWYSRLVTTRRPAARPRWIYRLLGGR